MKAQGAAIQGGLAVLGLLAAWGTWQREPERPPGEVIVLDIRSGDLEKIRYEDGPRWTEIERRRDGEPTTWIRLSAKTDPKPEMSTPEREVRGNEAADKLLERFAPLRGTRGLGVLDEKKLKELGLDTSKKKIQVTARGQTHVFIVGTSPFGVSEPYVMDDKDKRVYVLGGSLMSDLDSAQLRLVNRVLHSFKPTEFDAITVSAGAKRRELVQKKAESQPAAKLASKKTPDKADDMAKNWHDKVWRLYVTDVLGKGERPRAGEPQLAVEITYFMAGKQIGFLKLGRVTPPPTASGAAPPPGEVFAQTENTAGWVRLPASADELTKEADKVVAVE